VRERGGNDDYEVHKEGDRVPDFDGKGRSKDTWSFPSAVRCWVAGLRTFGRVIKGD